MMNPSNYPYTLSRFFQHMIEAVKYFQDSGNVKAETFAWIDGLDDLNETNLGHDIRNHGTEYCYSKRYDKKKSSVFEMAPPYVLVGEIDGTFDMPFKSENRPRKITHGIALYVLDKWVNQKDQNNTGADRTLGDVYRDTKIILRKVLEYFDGIQFIEIIKNDDSKEYGYYNTGLAQAMVTADEIKSFKTGGEATKVNEWYKNMMGELNRASRLSIIGPLSGSNLAGVRIELYINEMICEVVSPYFAFTGKEFVYGKI